MKRPLIFSGTTEGRLMSERLSRAGIAHIVCVATGYGELVMQKNEYADIRQGRLSEEEMRDMIAAEAGRVFDATHPYAAAVSENIRGACRAAGADYVRIVRSGGSEGAAGCSIRTFTDAADCAAALKDTEGNILLTTGSKELSIYAKDPEVRNRLFVRVLPSEESIRLCDEAGISGRQVIAMQGPFRKDLDLALMRQFDIKLMVTKASGRAGGFEEKLAAASEASVPVFIIGRPSEETGLSASEALSKYFGLAPSIRIDLVGIGPGRSSLMTVESRDAVMQADFICGAARMIKPYADKEKYKLFRAEDLIPLIEEKQPERMAVLFSGDTGFYSGAEKMKPSLEKWLSENGYEYEIVIHPGVSAFSYLSSASGVSFTGAKLCSMHGKSGDYANFETIMEEIARNERTVIIMSGPEDAAKLGSEMSARGLGDCRVILGRDLSYPDEKIYDFTPEECAAVTEPGLYTALVINKAE